MRVALITLHYFGSKRRAGFHWLAEAYARAGHDVTFMTVSLSWLSWLRRDHRFGYPVRADANRLRKVAPGITSYVWFTPWHPANLRRGLLNRASHSLFAGYGELALGDVEARLRDADLIIIESSPGILLFDRIKRINPAARLVYRVSDDLRVLGNHPVVIDTETRVAPKFDLISVPSPPMLRLFPGSRVAVHHHGVRGDMLDAPSLSPYSDRWEANLVFVGIAYLDGDFLARASRLFPRYAFHVVGPSTDIPTRPNVIAHGELPYLETVRYIQHADVGLHTLTYRPGAEAFTHSLKVLQYAYCRLPIIAPDFMRMEWPFVSMYHAGDDASIQRAVNEAMATDRGAIARDGVHSWDDVARLLVGA